MTGYYQHLFRGLGIALVTPFSTDGTIDYASLERLIEYQISEGADFLCVLATTGETPCLSVEEKKWVKEFVVKTVNHRKPIVMGVGGNNTAALVDEIQSTNFNGIDGLLSVTPFYNRPTQDGLYLHFKTISSSTDLPIILYNVPSRTGVNLEPATVARLSADCQNIVAIKEASGRIEQVKELRRLCSDNFCILSGDDALTLDMIAEGAQGAISVVGNALPKYVSRMIHSALDKNIDEARFVNNMLTELYTLLFVDGNPAGIKSMLHTMGFIENQLRLPLVPVKKETANSIERIASKFNITAHPHQN